MAITGNNNTDGSVSSNETLGSITNSIARRLWKRTPTDTEKEDIHQMVNDVQKDICNLHNNRGWQFMDVDGDVAGYTVDTTGLTKASSTSTPAEGDSAAIWYAEKFVSDSDVVTIPVSSTTGFDQVAGFGNPNLTMYAVFLGDNDGEPDEDNVLSTSEAITMTDSQVTNTGVTIGVSQAQPSQVTFTFPQDGEFAPDTTYWYAIKILYDNTGATLKVAQRGTSSTTSYTSTQITGLTWVAVTTGQFDYNVTYNTGSFITEITLPVTVNKLYNIYSGEINCLENTNTKDGVTQPMNTFIIKKIDSNGSPVILVRSNAEEVIRWGIEYKSKVPLLANDTDIPIIPPDYRYLLRVKAELEYIAIGEGMQTPTRETTLATTYAGGIEDLRRLYLPNPENFKWSEATGDYPIADKSYSKRLSNSNTGRSLKSRGCRSSGRRVR